jgi:hypothetical protein
MRFFRRRPLRWSVVVSAPGGTAGEQWGDTWFATDLVNALQRAGQEARVVFRKKAEDPARDEDDVVLVLRGLRRVRPRPGRTTWMLWVISHPDLVEADEPADFAAVFAASESWSRAQEFTVPVTPLLQATAPERFFPGAGHPDTGSQVLFVGSTRGEFRPIVRDAIDAGAAVDVFGVGWEDVIAPEFYRGAFLDNADVPAAYASAHIVLNDHWRDMADEGFLSNRLFDAVATATRVISDPARGLTETFGTSVFTVAGPQELAAALARDPDTLTGDYATRVAAAARIAELHSFDVRAAQLIETAERLRE